MHFRDKSSRCRQANPYVDIFDLVDEFRLGPARRVHLRALDFCDGLSSLLTLACLGLIV